MKENMNEKNELVLRKAAQAIKDRGHDGDARLADSVLGVIQSMKTARATPAATTSGAAGTIAAFVPQGYANETEWLRQQLADATATITAHDALLGERDAELARLRAAPVVGKIEGYLYEYWHGGERLEDPTLCTDFSKQKPSDQHGYQNVRAVVAAPVVGEAVAWMHVLPDGEVFGAEPGQDKQALLSKSDAEGEVRVHGGTVRPLVYGGTAPHAAKEAGKVFGFSIEGLDEIADDLETNFDQHVNVGNVTGLGDCLLDTAPAAAAKFIRAALARTTNKENDNG